MLLAQISQPYSLDQALQTPREQVDELARQARRHPPEIDRGPSLRL